MTFISYRALARGSLEIDPVGDWSGLRGAADGACGGSGEAAASDPVALTAALSGATAFDEGPCGFAGAGAAAGGAA